MGRSSIDLAKKLRPFREKFTHEQAIVKKAVVPPKRAYSFFHFIKIDRNKRMTGKPFPAFVSVMEASWLKHFAAWTLDVQGMGWSGWLVFVVLYALACLFFVPGSVLSFCAGAIYGFGGGLMLAIVGNGLSALLSLLITRYLLRDWAARYFAQHPTMDDLGTAVKEDGWRIVSLTHLSPIMPFTLVNYAFGLTKIPALEFLLATMLGGLPGSCVYVYLGRLAGNLAVIGPDRHRHHPIEWVLQGVGLIATIVVTVYITRRATQALKKRLPHQSQDSWRRRRKKPRPKNA